MKTYRIMIALASVALCFSAAAQDKTVTDETLRPSFVEGFHGGLYGHYPVMTYTKYMTDLLDQNPGWKFSVEIEPETWDTVKVMTPAAFARFRDEAVKGKKVEFTNPTIAQPYCYNVSGESLIRQFYYGIAKLKANFPGISFHTYAVEEPCFTSALPQILNGFGIRYASIKNPNTTWGGYAAAHGGEIVRWIGPDGSSVIASPRHELEELGDTVWDTKSNGLYPEYYEACVKAGYKHPVGMCYQDAGWTNGLWNEYNEKGNRNVRYVTWKEYFEDIAGDVKPEDYVFHQEDVRGGLVWGSQVLQQIAQEVREGENRITTAEKMGVIANIANGYRYNQADVDEAWRCLLLSQHHDSWIVPYNGLKGQGTWADWICSKWTVTTDKTADRVIAEAGRSFMSRQKDAIAALRVYNTMGHSRKEVVSVEAKQIPVGAKVTLSDSEGKEVDSWFGLVDGAKTLVFMAEAPAFGYATYTIAWEEGSARADAPKKVKTLENDMYRIRFDRRHGGTIRSIYDKRSGRTVTAKKGVAFGEFKGYFCNEGRYYSSADSPATVTLVEDNAFEKKVRICGMIAAHPFVEIITLREGDPKIGLDLTIDWQSSPEIGTFSQNDAYNNRERSFYDESGKLNIYFPSTSEGGKLIKNAPFDVCESRLESTRFTNYADIKHNIILNWVDLEGTDGSSIAILSDHTTAYTYGEGTTLGLTIQFSGNGLWGRDYKITGPTTVNMAILPHTGDWTMVEDQDREWNEPFIITPSIGVRNECMSFMDAAGYQISAACMMGDEICVRLYNGNGTDDEQTILVDGSIKGIRETDLEGNTIAAVAVEEKDGMKAFKTAMPRFGFRTYILER